MLWIAPELVEAKLCLLGERDKFLMSEMARESLPYCTSAEVFPFPDATHWLQHEEPEKVSQLLVEFFQS